MKDLKTIIYGAGITLAIFVTAVLMGYSINLNHSFIPDSFITHTIMLACSVLAIFILRKNLKYRISLPRFRNILKPVAIALAVTIAVNIIMTVITKLAGAHIEGHALLSNMNPAQVFVFIFIYASVAEELLFRGYLLNSLKSLKSGGVSVFGLDLSLPVIISAFAFGLAHLILITTGASPLFLVRIVIFTTSLGLVAGYYQEKYDNNIYAIIVHMSGNTLAVAGSLIMHSNAGL